MDAFALRQSHSEDNLSHSISWLNHRSCRLYRSHYMLSRLYTNKLTSYKDDDVQASEEQDSYSSQFARVLRVYTISLVCTKLSSRASYSAGLSHVNGRLFFHWEFQIYSYCNDKLNFKIVRSKLGTYYEPFSANLDRRYSWVDRSRLNWFPHGR